jgi:hypothetical protein
LTAAPSSSSEGSAPAARASRPSQRKPASTSLRTARPS